VFCNARIAGNGVMQLSHAESKDQNASNVIVLTSPKTIVNLDGVVRLMYTFKCSNCRGDHQADSNQCPFWRHRFNREWHQRKYTEICENRSKSICSEMNGEHQQ